MSDVLKRKYDVAIIGSGAGGGTLAYALAKHGCKVLLIEQGCHLPLEADNRSSEGMFGRKYAKSEAMDICGCNHDVRVHAYVGGATKLYGAALYRLRAEDFGQLNFPGGVSPAWPISYQSLETYYTLAEKLYKVHGNADDDPTEPPHSEPYPYPAIGHEPTTLPLVKKLQEQGLRVHSIPKGIDLRENGNCSFCTTCDAYACPTNGKLDTEVACIKPALETGNLTLITQATCRKLTTDESGENVSGMELEYENGIHSVDANIYVAACGILHSPALLLRSANHAHPNGLANSSGQVGRNLAGHSAAMFFLPGLRKLGDIHQKTFAVNDFYLGDEKVKFPLGIMQAVGRMPVRRHVRKWLAPFAEFVGERSISCFIMCEEWPDPNNRVTLDEKNKIKVEYKCNNKTGFRTLRSRFLKYFRKAGYPAAFCSRQPMGGLPWHPVGTVRFGRDPKTSVLDPFCKTHDVNNLYVVDSCFMPTAGAINTSLTIMAQALRVADHLHEKLNQSCVRT
jgi:choline dehydrogenase-like flavoprotein